MLCTIKLPNNLNLLNSQFPRSKYQVEEEERKSTLADQEVQEVSGEYSMVEESPDKEEIKNEIEAKSREKSPEYI